MRFRPVRGPAKPRGPSGAIVDPAASSSVGIFGALTPTPYDAWRVNYPYAYTTPQDPQRHPNALLTQQVLRNIADTFDILRSCINHLKREVLGVPFTFVGTDGRVSGRQSDRIAAANRFFSLNGGCGGRGVRVEDFICQVIEDSLVIGAAAIYCDRDGSGNISQCPAIDSATIRLVVDGHGWVHYDDGAFAEQWIQGQPTKKFYAEELIYAYPAAHARSWNPYPGSPVEWLALTVQSALSADRWNRAWLTEGTTPADLIALPEGWSTQNIQDYMRYWDAMMSGNIDRRVKTRFVPSGSQRVAGQSRKDQDFTEFELWLARRVGAIFGVHLASLGFAGEQFAVTQNSAMDATSAFGAGNLINFVEALLTQICEEAGFDGVRCKFIRESPDDLAVRAKTNSMRIGGGFMTINEARTAEGWQPIEGGDQLLIPVTSQSMKSFEQGDSNGTGEQSGGNAGDAAN